VEVFKLYFEKKPLSYLPRNVSMFESPKLVQACWCRHNWCSDVGAGTTGARMLYDT